MEFPGILLPRILSLCLYFPGFKKLRVLFKMESSALESHPLSLSPMPFRPQNPQDWEPYKEAVVRLYAEMELSAVIEAMEEQHNFRAT